MIDRDAKKPWVVYEYKDHGKGQWYRYSIYKGHNLWTGESISWSVPTLDDPRFDLSQAKEVGRAA